MHTDARFVMESSSVAEQWAARLYGRGRTVSAVATAGPWLAVAYFAVSALRAGMAGNWSEVLLNLGVVALGAFFQWERSGVRRLIERYESRLGHSEIHSERPV